MARRHRYEEIADALRRQIEAGAFTADPRLPSEADLGAQYKASRVTIRKALEVLRDEGRVAARQGSGWFVTADPLRQSLGRLATIEGQLDDEGRDWARRVIDFGFVTAPRPVAERLGETDVLRVRRLNLADGSPFALVTVWCPARLASGLSRDDVEAHPFTELLDVPLAAATQTIRAGAATPEEAERLGLLPDAPVLRCERTTCDDEGSPVLTSEHTYPAHLTEFVVELSSAEPSLSAPGLRLVR